jgi:serine/threonine protein kinase
MKEPSISDSRKAAKENSMRLSEANFLRFLRTKERPDNFSTLKIIGKGAFGEVKLVQKKNDGTIYALKSLVKQEMVGPIHTLEEMLLTSRRPRKTSWLTCGQNVIFWPSRTVRGSSGCTPPSRTTLFSTCSWSFCLAVT